ncbi:hypothetical protein GGF46_003729, partial [Coemansia sp. RSA 552]
MVNEVNLFIAVTAGIVVLVIALMLVARRFHGLRNTAQAEGRARRPNPLPLRLTGQPTKPYNPFSKDELQLLQAITLLQPDIDLLNAEAKATDKELLRYASPECSICLVPYEPEVCVRVLGCGHTYHIECIDVWLTKRSARCPICKVDTRAELGLALRQESAPSATQESTYSADESRSLEPRADSESTDTS